MTSRPVFIENMSLKECVPLQGFMWQNRPSVLRSLERDKLVLRSFRKNDLPISPGNIGLELNTVVMVAGLNSVSYRLFDPMGHPGQPKNISGREYEFLSTLADDTRIGCRMPTHVFVELFRELVNARIRFLNHNSDYIGTISSVAEKMDIFLKKTEGYYSDDRLLQRLEEEILKSKGGQQGPVATE
ncbi:hypothetical protein B0T20DRAFT_496779 [Sordaria brevicollis]|uniref:Uncharacterized protein n=1 Tax=Sordaria brevicollis TaxID=83679 RepID=A0AAE0PHZ8_SORBR|nr:hypothetical protein B0T20DRAFT_496779 [Sordaria brevicollis]